MMPSSPSATDLTAGASVTIENTMSDTGGRRARRLGELHAGLDQRLRLVLAAVEAGDGMSRRHQPGHDAHPHGAETDKTDVHVASLQVLAGG